jgi:hypothetical protein
MRLLFNINERDNNNLIEMNCLGIAILSDTKNSSLNFHSLSKYRVLRTRKVLV